MNGKILLLLIVVAAVAVFAAYRLNQPPVSGDPAPAQSALLYPGLGDKLNTIKTIRIVGPGATLIAELARGDAGWTVINKGGYPAAFATIRTLLLALAGAEIVEQKTANPEFYSRLGVSDIDAENANSKVLEIKADNDSWTLIVGNTATGGASGTYVRRAGEAPSLLINETINVAEQSSDWLMQPLLDIPGERVQRAVIHHANGETVTVLKEKQSDENFTLFNLLAGRELSYDTVANPTGHGITTLELEDVLPKEQVKLPEQTITTDYFTFDGLKISAQIFQQDDTNYALVSAGFDQAQAKRFAPASDANQDDKSETNDAAAEAAILNQRLMPWVFAISDFKYRNMTKTLEDFLKPLAETPVEESRSTSSPAGQAAGQSETPAATQSSPGGDTPPEAVEAVEAATD